MLVVVEEFTLCVYLVLRHPFTQLTVFNFRFLESSKKIMACNYESLEEEILDMIFDDEDDEEQFNGFTRAETEEIEREFEEDDSDFEDLLADEDSASGDINLNDIAWSNDDDSEVEVPAFTEQVGLSVQLPRTATALDYFKLLFTADLITTIVNNTNNYATETILDSEDMRENWLHTNAEEMMAFLGVVVFMGIVKLPKVSMYFSADPRIYQVAVHQYSQETAFFNFWSICMCLLLLKYQPESILTTNFTESSL